MQGVGVAERGAAQDASPIAATHNGLQYLRECALAATSAALYVKDKLKLAGGIEGLGQQRPSDRRAQ